MLRTSTAKLANNSLEEDSSSTAVVSTKCHGKGAPKRPSPDRSVSANR